MGEKEEEEEEYGMSTSKGIDNNWIFFLSIMIPIVQLVQVLQSDGQNKDFNWKGLFTTIVDSR